MRVATGRGAELGVLFRGGDALQRLAEARTFVFDKTGTLTEGRPALTDLIPTPGTDETALLVLAAAIEARSEHPIAHAVVEAARARSLAVPEVADFEAIPGFGAMGLVNGQAVAVGAARLLDRFGIDAAPLAAEAARLAAEGRTPVYVAVDGRLAGLLAVADPVRSTTPAALDALRAQGVTLTLLTGDARATAEAVAGPLGITTIHAEVLPGGKADVVADLQQHGPVAFVGDGLNDAPALARADVGVALGTGTDVAIEAAGVLLPSGDLRALPRGRALAAATLRNIRQNLFWAFAYNVVLIPVAAGVLYPVWGLRLSPELAAGAMGLSSVFVLVNALRLRASAPERCRVDGRTGPRGPRASCGERRHVSGPRRSPIPRPLQAGAHRGVMDSRPDLRASLWGRARSSRASQHGGFGRGGWAGNPRLPRHVCPILPV